MRSTRASESGLLVFISSRQSEEMKQARCEAEKAIDEFPLTRPWVFENMPASSEDARDHYVRYASKADFVIWLVGDETTSAVVDEIHACMSVHGRLLAFMLPTISRDEHTCKLIDEVSEYAKWREIEAIDELGTHIRAALRDEIIRQFQNPELPGRRPRLIREREETILRCKQSWTVLGVPDAVAVQLARDQTVGYGISLPDKGILMVVGDQGAGKTLALQRLYQNAIDEALEDSSKPFPIFVAAGDIQGSLRDHVDSATKGYAFADVQGALILVDGLDEIGRDSANRLLDNAAPYVEANPNMALVVATRLLPGIRDIGQHIEVPQMDGPDILQLVTAVAGRTVQPWEMRSWPESVRDASQRPLFAVMIGTELRNHHDVSGIVPSDLVGRLANRALSEAGTRRAEVDELLQGLAVMAVSGGGSVPRSEVSPNLANQRLLLDSRLVSNDEAGNVDFLLPIFREWFASRALVEGTHSLEDLVPVSERWLIPITIAIHSDNEDRGQSLMATLTRTDPGIAGLVLEEVESGWKQNTGHAWTPGSAGEVGHQIRKAMEDWGEGLGALMPVIGPVTNEGRLTTLGIDVCDLWVSTSWYQGEEELGEVVSIPQEDGILSTSLDWPEIQSTSELPQRCWPWKIAKDNLTDSLSDILVSGQLARISPEAVRELAYEFASSVAYGRSYGPEPGGVAEALHFIDVHEKRGELSLQIGYNAYDFQEIGLVRCHLEKLMGDGEDYISDPWPGPDRSRPEGRTSWQVHEVYTDKRLLERAQTVYQAALQIYADMVGRWFQAYGNRLALALLLPAKLEGRLTIPRRQEGNTDPPRSSGDPVLTWWPRPLNEREESQVAFRLQAGGEAGREETRRSIEVARTESFERMGHFRRVTTRLRVFGPRPAGGLAHKWLTDGLRTVGWKDLPTIL